MKDEKNTIKIGERLRAERNLKGYSQEYMGHLLDMSQNSYSKIERDITHVSVNRIYQIAEILEISVFKLLPKSKYSNPLDLSGILKWFKIVWFKILLLIFWRKKFGGMKKVTPIK